MAAMMRSTTTLAPMVRLRGGMSSLADTLAILTPTPPPRRFDAAGRTGDVEVFRRSRGSGRGPMVRLRGGMSSLADTLAILTPTPPPRRFDAAGRVQARDGGERPWVGVS
jgi:hypothetical protein